MNKITLRSAVSDKKSFDRDFTSFPYKLYSKKECVLDTKTELSILDGSHVLSKDFHIEAFLVYENDKPQARAILTYYEDDSRAYLGFFEAYDNSSAVELLFKTVEKKCLSDNKTEIIGPINASFWIGYRFKVEDDTDFKLRYTGEPYNKPYYCRLWEENGFIISDRYYSNRFRIPSADDTNAKCVKRYKESLQKGYEYQDLDLKNFDAQLDEVYDLFIDLYSSFPGFTFVNKEKFHAMNQSLKYILDPSMAKFVYKNHKLVAFFICLPNIGNLNCNITPYKLLKLLWARSHPKEYILLYMGVNKEELGLGPALGEAVKKQIQIKQVESIGALIHEGKVTGNYYRNLVIGKYNYVLLHKPLNQ